RPPEADDAGRNVEQAQQYPERELAPALDVEGGDDLADALHDHHDADDQHGPGGRPHDAPQRNHARDHRDDAKRHDPSPFDLQPPQPFAQVGRTGSICRRHAVLLLPAEWTLAEYNQPLAVSRLVWDILTSHECR